MALTPYQIVAPLIALVAVAYAWNLVMKQKKTIWEALLWTLFWGAVAVIALYPRAMDTLTVVTGIKNRENAVVFTFLGILLFIVFYIIVRLEDLEQRQNRIVRSIALKEAGLEEDKEDSHH